MFSFMVSIAIASCKPFKGVSKSSNLRLKYVPIEDLELKNFRINILENHSSEFKYSIFDPYSKNSKPYENLELKFEDVLQIEKCKQDILVSYPLGVYEEVITVIPAELVDYYNDVVGFWIYFKSNEESPPSSLLSKKVVAFAPAIHIVDDLGELKSLKELFWMRVK